MFNIKNLFWRRVMLVTVFPVALPFIMIWHLLTIGAQLICSLPEDFRAAWSDRDKPYTPKEG